MTRPILPAMRRFLVLLVLTTLFASCGGQATVGADRPVRILAGTPTTLDPAVQGDAGSAAVTAQLFESLTSFDAGLHVRPALAESWRFRGRRAGHLPPAPGPDLLGWQSVAAVGRGPKLAAPDRSRPSVAARVARARYRRRRGVPSRAIQRPGVGRPSRGRRGRRSRRRPRPARDGLRQHRGGPDVLGRPAGHRLGVGGTSGGYTLSGETDTGLTLTANPHYWAGTPAIKTIELVGDLGGRAPVDAFAAGDLDYTPVSGIDATWVGYDETLGPQLRQVDSLSVEYYGFETSKPPFDDARVRKAFGEAVDWRRMAALSGGDGTAQVANSMVPPGIPGRSDKDFVPAYDPTEARKLLADAGYPGGAGFPTTVLMTGGAGFDAAIVAEIKRELGITLQAETMGDGYFDRLSTEPPAMWALDWVADYPGRNDFLGVLLGTGASNDYGHWSSPEFDAAIHEAVSASDSAVASAAYDRAETVVRDQVPVVPVVYGPGWALSRKGLLGAGQNGLGIVRMAGLAWAD